MYFDLSSFREIEKKLFHLCSLFVINWQENQAMRLFYVLGIRLKFDYPILTQNGKYSKSENSCSKFESFEFGGNRIFHSILSICFVYSNLGSTLLITCQASTFELFFPHARNCSRTSPIFRLSQKTDKNRCVRYE